MTAHRNVKTLILLADDNVDSRELCAEFLAYSGFEVALAVNGLEAVDQAGRCNRASSSWTWSLTCESSFVPAKPPSEDSPRWTPRSSANTLGGAGTPPTQPARPTNFSPAEAQAAGRKGASKTRETTMTDSPSRRLILVVDDDPDIRDTLAESLVDAGFDVVGAANGVEALEYLRGERLPSLIFLDLMMPIMNGPDFRAQQLLDPRAAGVPVVVISAAADAPAIAHKLNARACITKPVSFETVLAMINAFC